MNPIKTKCIRISVIAAAFLIMAAAYLTGPGKRTQTTFTIDGEEQSMESADPADLSSGDGQETASPGKEVPDSGPDSGEHRPDAEKLAVYVCGHVVSPGVVFLKEGSRICDAVAAAGGFAPDASQDSVNLAMPVSDGLQIRVPGKNETVNAAAGIAGGTNSAGTAQGTGYPLNGGRININTASGEELQQLPGIGKSRAEDIIAYRAKKPFDSIEEIMKVPGIKKGAFGKIKDRIAV